MKSQLAVFGEALFDIFPDGSRVLGGAPFNVAWHLQAMGMKPDMITGLGEDPEGTEISRQMSFWTMNQDYIQIDPKHPTGRVNVKLISGEPDYDIQQDCAYDFIGSDGIPNEVDFLYFGSLALRGQQNRKTMERLTENASVKFLDVNLRDPWWEREAVIAWMEDADWIKLNRDELERLTGIQKDDEEIFSLVNRFQLEGMVVTKGSEGSDLYLKNQQKYQVQPVEQVKLLDTVGAGDAFTSILITGILKKWDWNVTLTRAQEFASAIVGVRGATVSDPNFYQKFRVSWGI